ncbi:Glutamyl-tRNA(Gln) amidotransferase subunit A [Brevundimonas sp. NIBR10]|uniref:amidase n=1 Tax=Brevundimonas sp. NIBR10 TaxID=3015997 RepID=UPI0022F1463F|nr:amidase [Brevundimonas sp. NIBR10]WGM48285.1 Glutamyl-tRNA(Gln) amidotransferase subunit A [Brevundimonas sp. NIBR10]
MKTVLLSAFAVAALSLSACATPNDDGSWTMPGDNGGRIYQPPTAAAVVDGQFPARSAIEGSVALILSADTAFDPPLNAVIAIAPAALAEQPIDIPTGALVGLPVLLKDNIETADMPTTAGSLALAANAPGRDAPLVTRLRTAGAVVLGKTNLSEWANIRSTRSISGWSAVGGLTSNPYDPARTACGSSSGSAVAVAVGLAPVAIGTETNGSITCPASVNGVVGFKPTVGLVSRTHIVPISHSQDTAGPIATTVEDAAIVMTAIAGSDPLDAATAEADARKVDYRAALDANSLSGTRIGVLRYATNYSADTMAAFETSLQAMRDAGAVLVDITTAPDLRTIGGESFKVLMFELKADLNAYLASTDPVQVPTRTLADLIAFNAATPAETVLFGQELFEQAQAKGDLTTQEYIDARATSFRLAGPEGIDRMMADNDVVALIAPTTSRAWTNDREDDDNAQGSTSTIAAVAGYPHLTVPMGFDRGMPVGISFIGGKWDDATILSLGYAFEQKTHARRPPN